MSQIKVARYSGVKYEFVDGYARVPVLEGSLTRPTSPTAPCSPAAPSHRRSTPSPSTTSSLSSPRARAM
ncbi:MAG: hypothetical protein ACLR0P_09255 [Oscillospiraceae bacterium]